MLSIFVMMSNVPEANLKLLILLLLLLMCWDYSWLVQCGELNPGYQGMLGQHSTN